MLNIQLGIEKRYNKNSKRSIVRQKWVKNMEFLQYQQYHINTTLIDANIAKCDVVRTATSGKGHK